MEIDCYKKIQEKNKINLEISVDILPSIVYIIVKERENKRFSKRERRKKNDY